MIRVLVAEDSSTVRELLVTILESDPEITVVGQAKNGREAVQLAVQLAPDLVTMDIHMPLMDGLDASKEIMIRAPVPILIVSSSVSDQDVALSLSATQVGALMAVRTPPSHESKDFRRHRDNLLAMAKAMAQVKVVRQRYARSRVAPLATAPPQRGRVRLIAIAASTGGPAALQRILMDLPADLSAPILVVQHLSPGFVEGLCSWLARSCRLRVKIAVEGETLRNGTVYVAPDDRHLGVLPSGALALSKADRIQGFRPSATHLFESVAERYGRSAAAVILTGMGRDGVAGLRAIHAAQGVVIAQDEETSIVYGMPNEAVRAGTVDEQLPISGIADRLIRLTQDASVQETT